MNIKKAGRIEVKDGLVQDIKLNRGTYTFSAWVLRFGTRYSIGLYTEAGTWLNFDMTTQTTYQVWSQVKLTFTIYEPCTKLSLMNDFASEAARVFVLVPMIEEGTNAGTYKLNELDLEESLANGNVSILLSNQSYNFKGSTTTALVGSTYTDILIYKLGVKVLPTSITVGTLPTGMTSSVDLVLGRVTFNVTTAMTSADGIVPITFVVDSKSYTLNFSYSISFKGADGSAKDLKLDASSQVIRKLKNGTWLPSADVTVTAVATNTTITKWEYSINGGSFSETVPIGVSRSGNNVYISPSATIAYGTYAVRVTDGIISDTITIIRLEDGTDGNGIVSVVSRYFNSTSGTTSPSENDWLPSRPDLVKGKYLWVETTTTYSSKPATVTYNVTYYGDDGLSKGIFLDSATQVIKYTSSGTTIPATSFTVIGTGLNVTISAWTYSVNGGAYSSTLPTGVTRSGNTITINPATVTFDILSIKASGDSVFSTITIGTLRDGAKGLPGQLPVQIEWVQGDTHYNNDTVVSYIYYRTGNTWWRLKSGVTQLTAPATPDSNYQQLSSVEELVTKILIAEQGNLGGLIFKDNQLISQKGTINGDESVDYGNINFRPNAYLNGEEGVIMANRMLTPFVIADPDKPGDLQSKLTNAHNIYLEASGNVDYDWETHYLPGNGTSADKEFDGLNLRVYAPYGCNKRVKLLPASSSALIFTDDMGSSISAIKIGVGTRERIHLSAVWDRVYNVLNWVVTSRSSHQLAAPQGAGGNIIVPNIFKEGDIIVKGDVSVSASLSNIKSRYMPYIQCSISSSRFTLSVPRGNYYNALGSLIDRSFDVGKLDIQVYPNSTTFYNTYIRKYLGTANGVNGVHFDIEFRLSNGASATAIPFSFIIRASDYIFNNQYLDDTL